MRDQLKGLFIDLPFRVIIAFMNKEKSFGIVFFLFFLALGIYPLYNSQSVNLPLILVSFLFLFLTYVFPRVLYFPNKLWLKLGGLLGKITSPIIMFFIFFFVVTPTSLALKLFKKSLLLKFKKNHSYWTKREDKATDMSNQF